MYDLPIHDKRTGPRFWRRRLFLWGGFVLAAGVVISLSLGLFPVAQLGGARAEPVTGGRTELMATTPLRPVVIEQEMIIADAVVVPVQHAALSMAAGGIVAEVLAVEGSDVAAGQVILRLKNARQQAAVAQARANLLIAQAHLDELRAGARPPEIAAAQANVEAAQARVAALTEGARSEEVAAARATLQAAQAELDQLYSGPAENERIAAEAELANAEALRQQAQAAYDRVSQQSDIAMRPESLQLQEATNSYNAAKARYDALFAEPNSDAVATARAKVQQAQADLNKLFTPASQNAIAEAEADQRRAQADLALVSGGARIETLMAAEAEVSAAEAALRQAEAELAETELLAPFTGTLAAINVKVGEQVTAGTPVVQLADLTTWQIETQDLNELGIVNVREGDAVDLTFDALDNLALTGAVVRIKPIGQNTQGDITYTAIIRPDEQDRRLRWNMTAVVTIR